MWVLGIDARASGRTTVLSTAPPSLHLLLSAKHLVAVYSSSVPRIYLFSLGHDSLSLAVHYGLG